MFNNSKEILRIDGLKMRYPNSNHWVLDGFKLEIGIGERIALIGSSGCGKSTLAKVLLDLLPPESLCEGNIFLEGKSLRGLDKAVIQQMRGNSIGLVFQDPMTRLNPLMTVGDHLLDTLDAGEKSKTLKWKINRAHELLDLVRLDSKRFNAYPHEFSGGMRQRLAIALAIALDPPLLIADEPTTSLDVVIANQIMSELSRLCDDLGKSLLLISHDLTLAAKWCHRIAILDQGKIVEESSSLNVLTNPQSEVGKKLVGAVKSRQRQNVKTLSFRQSILQVENLRCWHSLPGWPWRLNWLKAVDEISFTLFSGETLGIVGSSGCGKSTLCRSLMGLMPLRGGIVRLNGENLFDLTGNFLRENRQQIQMVFQDPLACLNPKMSIGDAIADSLLIHDLCNKSQAKEHTRELLLNVGLTPPEQFQNRYPRELSGGQQQRVAIARALALRPKVLICDESVSMLDSEIQVEILKLLSDLQKQLGIAIVFVTHDLVVANSFCDRIIVLDQGRIIEEGPSDQILNFPKHPNTKKLVFASPKLPLMS
tara:strand:+ start:45439 stop:47049 length:1611 start_codon:yes stop_codon:yes gene_type:complete